MKWLQASVSYSSYVLVKLGFSFPFRFDWRDIWAERGMKAEDDHAELVDGRPRSDENQAILAVTEQIRELNLLPAGSIWLDVGIGSGQMHLSLLAVSNDITSIGCDYSFPSLRYCKENVDVPLVACLAQYLPFRTGQFDFILFYSVSHYLPGNAAPLAVIAEFKRVLKPGGAILIGDCLSYRTLTRRHFNPRCFFPTSSAFSDIFTIWAWK
jgi:SAM-dependent methyltransferase